METQLNPESPEEGLYFNVPEKVYRSAKGYSQSQVKQCEYSMKHFHTAMTTPPKKPTDAQVDGTMLHGLTLQKKKLFIVVPENAPNKPTKAQLNAKEKTDKAEYSIKWWKDFDLMNPGMEHVSQSDSDRYYKQRDAIMAHPDASEMLGRATGFEVAAFKRHKTGLMLKGLADCLTQDDNEFMVVPDIKTCQLGGASYAEFQDSIPRWGYHRQAAFYKDLFGASYFLFICVEKEAPYEVACYLADHDMLVAGRWENEADLEKIAECEKTGIWPGYPTGIRSITLPDWKKRKMV